MNTLKTLAVAAVAVALMGSDRHGGRSGRSGSAPRDDDQQLGCGYVGVSGSLLLNPTVASQGDVFRGRQHDSLRVVPDRR